MTFKPYDKISGEDWVDSVLDKDLTTPPGSPSVGDRYIVASVATGDWTGRENDVAEWNGVSWQFFTVSEGMATWVEDEDTYYKFDGLAWDLFNTIGSSLWSESAGNVYRSTGRVGIGVSAPSGSLHVSNDGTLEHIYLEDNNQTDANGPYFYLHNDTGVLSIGRSNRSGGLPASPVDILNLDYNGKVSIGGTVTTTPLTVYSSTNDIARFESNGATSSPKISLYRNSTLLADLLYDNASSLTKLVSDSSSVAIDAGGNGLLVVGGTSGNVAIGSLTPPTTARFQVAGSNGGGAVSTRTNNNTNTLDSIVAHDFYSGATGTIQLSRISGILKDITGSAEKGDLRFQVMNSGSLSEALYLHNTARVGIGTNDPDLKLHVVRSSTAAVPGNVDARGTIKLENTDTTESNFAGVLFNGATTNGTSIDGGLIAAQYKNKTTTDFDTDFVFSLRNASGARNERMRLYASGSLNVGGATGGDLGLGAINAKGFYIDGIPLISSANNSWQTPVLDKDLTSPPPSPSTGDRYIVGGSATGDWAGHDDEIAEWSGAWVYTTPTEGFGTWVIDENRIYFYESGAWQLHGSFISHAALVGAGTNTHAQIDSHIANTSNPHSVTKAQVGLNNVEDILNNYTATTAPTATDDSDSGYTVGSRWINTTSDLTYVCVDDTASSAIWVFDNGDPAFVSESAPDTLPSATGADAIAVADGATASGARSIAIGALTSAAGSDSISIGYNGDASKDNNILLGSDADGSLYNSQMVISLTGAAGNHTQIRKTSLYVETTGATQTLLVGAGESAGLPISSNTCHKFKISVLGIRTETIGEIASYTFEGVINNIEGTTYFVGTPVKTILHEDDTAWDVIVNANDTADTLEVLVTGAAAKTIKWYAVVDSFDVDSFGGVEL